MKAEEMTMTESKFEEMGGKYERQGEISATFSFGK